MACVAATLLTPADFVQLKHVIYKYFHLSVTRPSCSVTVNLDVWWAILESYVGYHCILL